MGTDVVLELEGLAKRTLAMVPYGVVRVLSTSGRRLVWCEEVAVTVVARERKKRFSSTSNYHDSQ